MEQKEILKKVKQLEIKSKKHLNDLLAGSYHSVFKGQGIEFFDVKSYMYGDDVKNIDWKVTARKNEPYVKTFVEERELTVIIVIDASLSQNFGSEEQFKKDLTLEVSALLAFSALKNKDKVGLLIFTDKIELYISPKGSRNHILRIIREIISERDVNPQTDIANALHYLNGILKRKSIIFFISDFYSKDFKKGLKVASKKHDLVAIKINDELEKNIENVGKIRLQDNETGEEIVIDTSSKKHRENFEKHVEKQNEDIIRLFKSLSIDYINLTTNHPYLIPLIKFFKSRAKRY